MMGGFFQHIVEGRPLCCPIPFMDFSLFQLRTTRRSSLQTPLSFSLIPAQYVVAFKSTMPAKPSSSGMLKSAGYFSFGGEG